MDGDGISGVKGRGGGGSNRHAQQPRRIMLQLEILVRESLGAVNAGTARAVAVEEISTLDHEFSNLPSISCHGSGCLVEISIDGA